MFKKSRKVGKRGEDVQSTPSGVREGQLGVITTLYPPSGLVSEGGHSNRRSVGLIKSAVKRRMRQGEVG
ncbi:hypothetical protein OSTOST_14404 [Ostertagia ostertagi]